MDAFEDRHEGVEELQRDGHSVLYRARDREEGLPVLVRRLVRSRRFDVDVRAGLVAEAEYCARLACSRCPESEALTLEDGELVLEYKGADGVELDRVLRVLESSGRVLTAAASVALVSEVLHNAEAIARIKPPALELDAWGHGEIAPRSVMLGRDGFGRLYEVRLATSGFRSQSGPMAALCRAPELAGGVLFGTPASDVYAVGALVSVALFGSAPLAAASAEPLVTVLVRAADGAPGAVPAGLLEVLVVALATDPADRYRGPETLREALRTAMPLDLAGWRATAEGLAALARTLGADRGMEQAPEALFAAHPGLARVVGTRPPSIDEDVAAFAQDQVLSSSQAMAALSPLEDPRMTPRRGSAALPRRIAVVPRRVSRAVADAFDAPRSPVPSGEMRRMSPAPSDDPYTRAPGGVTEDLRIRAIDDLRTRTGDQRPMSSTSAPPGLEQPAADRRPTAPAPAWMAPAPIEAPSRAPPVEVSETETVMLDESEAARALEQQLSGSTSARALDPPRGHDLPPDERPTLEIIPSDPAPPRPRLEILPSDPAPQPKDVPTVSAPPEPPAQTPTEAPSWPLFVLVAVVAGGLGGLLLLVLR